MRGTPSEQKKTHRARLDGGRANCYDVDSAGVVVAPVAPRAVRMDAIRRISRIRIRLRGFLCLS